MKLFDFSLRFNGFPIDKARNALSKIQSYSEHDFQQYLNNQKFEILSYHKDNNTFYKKLTGTSDITSWDSVPVLTKRDLQQPLGNRLSDGFSANSVYVNKTSGSSGDPFIFAKDKWCHALTWAVIVDRFSWYDIDFNHSKQARFYGIPLDKKGYYKERLKDLFSNRIRFSVFDLSDPAFETCLKAFRKNAFDYINGYTSSIVQFAKFLHRENVVLNTVCPSLKACMVTSEMLFDSDKLLMEQQFGVPVINEYGASELDLIAFQNPEGQWQLNSETLFVEILDEHNKAVPHGEEGRVVITSLYNKANPFIRYDIGDIGIISKESTAKKPILEKLIGRTNDLAFLPSGKKAAGLTFYYITKSIIEDDGNVKEFIIEQKAINHFHIIYASSEELSDSRMSFIKKEMEHYLESGLNITFERQDRLNRSESGKLKQFISYLKDHS